MKENPREIKDALKKLPRSKQLRKTNENYSRMAFLQARLALKQETLEAIERRDARLNEIRLLYSQVVNARRPVSLSTEQLHQAPGQPTLFNGSTNSTELWSTGRHMTLMRAGQGLLGANHKASKRKEKFSQSLISKLSYSRLKVDVSDASTVDTQSSSAEIV